MKYLPLSLVVLAGLGIIAGFIVLHSLFAPGDLIILLNGLLVGSMSAIAVAYHELIWYAIKGEGVYNRVRQMTLGFALMWIVFGIGLGTSIYIRVADLPATAYTSVAFARYLAIVAAILQVTAPDFGLGLFHGRDRKVLTASIGIGLVVAVVTILLQGA